MGQPRYISKSLTAGSVNVIAHSQTPLGAGNLTLTSSPVTLDTQRQVLITQAADETGHNFTVYGKTDGGNLISEVVPGSNGASVHTSQNFLIVTTVAIDAAATGALQVGTNTVGATPWVMLDWSIAPFSVGLAVIVTGTVNYTVNYTYEDFTGTFPNPSGNPPTAFSITALAAKTANLDSNIVVPVTGIQLQINSGTGTAQLVVIQSGLA